MVDEKLLPGYIKKHWKGFCLTEILNAYSKKWHMFLVIRTQWFPWSYKLHKCPTKWSSTDKPYRSYAANYMGRTYEVKANVCHHSVDLGWYLRYSYISAIPAIMWDDSTLLHAAYRIKWKKKHEYDEIVYAQ